MATWKWVVRATYKRNVLPPRLPGVVVFESNHADDISMEVEIMALKNRGDLNIAVRKWVPFHER